MWQPCRQLLTSNKYNEFNYDTYKLITPYLTQLQLSAKDLSLPNDNWKTLISAMQDQSLQKYTSALNKYQEFLTLETTPHPQINLEIFKIALQLDLFETAKENYQIWTNNLANK